MAGINIEREHNLGVEEARNRVVRMESKLKDRYGVDLKWSGNEADVKGKGVKGKIKVDDSRVAIDLTLGLLLKPLAGKIKEVLERTVDKSL